MTKEQTFKEIDENSHIEKQLKKAGLSLCLIFSKEELKRFNLEHDDIRILDDAKIIKKNI